ncbi:hypothetical protein [Zooshikella harenae]|uniref:Uncharacterized protein n=1 Tax=Zooshikella harenae TaxID=2827238 RepID=A0ABS5ZH58_9GAMM|nr:hypothetical protein [Zooshikella harenae]MBU2712621.1 hypothetical protein [Zooshikella harenae]
MRIINTKYKAEWEEAIRLLHKFCPPSKSYVKSFEKFLNIDAIHNSMETLKKIRGWEVTSRRLDSVELVQEYYGEFLVKETGRVLVLPDLAWGVAPFVCHAEKLLERVEEGLYCELSSDEGYYEEFIDGCKDVVFVFESSGAVLAFDHHEGVVLAMPY